MKRIGLLVLLAGCATTRRPGEVEALTVAGRSIGVDTAKLRVAYRPAECEDQFPWMPGHKRPGSWTYKRNCSWGALVYGTAGINITWPPNAKYSTGGLCQGVYQYYEAKTFGVPDVYNATPRWTSGEASRAILKCMADVARAGH